jgi:hypothetical protein
VVQGYKLGRQRYSRPEQLELAPMDFRRDDTRSRTAIQPVPIML